MIETPEEYFAGRKWQEIPKAKKDFYEMVKPRVLIVGRDRYYQTALEKYPIATSAVLYKLEKKSISFADLYVLINKDDFYIRGQDYTDVMETTKRHELAEIYRLGFLKHEVWKRGFDPNDERISDQAHLAALGEQYRFAFDTGVETRLLEYIKSFVNVNMPQERGRQVIIDNVQTFEKVKRERLKKAH